MSKLKPNFTPTPNIFFDFYLPDLPEAELRCLLYIMRRTFGFQKGSDKISLSQFENGIKDKNGKVLDRGVGLTRKSIIKGLAGLEELKLIKSDKKGAVNRYTMSLSDTTVATVTDENGVLGLPPVSSSVYSDSVTDTPEVVEQVYTQKKGKESISKDSTTVQEKKKTFKDYMYIFKPLNPTGYNMWFSNKTQQKAVMDLVNQFTVEELEKKIQFIVKYREYEEPWTFPKPDSPYSFQSKHQKILDWRAAYKKLKDK